MTRIPKIQGEVGRCAESHDPDHIGKWFFTVKISFRGETQEYGPFGPWKTKTLARKELNQCADLFSLELGKLPERIPVPSIFPENSGNKLPKEKQKKKPGKGKRRDDERRRPILDACDL